MLVKKQKDAKLHMQYGYKVYLEIRLKVNKSKYY